MKKLTIADLRDLHTKIAIIEKEKHHLANSEFFSVVSEDIHAKMNLELRSDNLQQIKKTLEESIETIKNSSDYWNDDLYEKNAETNIKIVKNTIDDIVFHSKKVMICGRGEKQHPDFSPRFSTPTTNIISDLYITVDHDPAYTEFITRKGDYALCLIVDPALPKKITELGCNIYWFCPDFMDYDIPKLSIGKFPRGNSGLAAISLASYFKTKFILLSGIKLTDHYTQFIEGQKLVFEQVRNSGSKIFSLDGTLAEQITIEKWHKL
ncbi:MAG: hypothetical protein KGI19_04935 [Thaumarchaeota archaeon]|nr:hypothetical protein [Nitrososphaerota archaeon]